MNTSRIAQAISSARTRLRQFSRVVREKGTTLAQNLSHTIRSAWTQPGTFSLASIMRNLGKAWAYAVFSVQKIMRHARSAAPGSFRRLWSHLSFSHSVVASLTGLLVYMMSSIYFQAQSQRHEVSLRDEFKQKEQALQTQWQTKVDELKREHEATLAMAQREMDRRVAAAQSDAASRVAAIESSSASKIAEAQRRSGSATSSTYSSSSSPSVSSTFGKALIDRATKPEPIYREEQCRACSATGNIECATCKGVGKVRCKECVLGTQSCDECDGKGTVTKGFFTKETVLCSKCSGSKRTTCPDCEGTTMVDCGFWFGCNGTGKRSCPKCIAGKIKLRVN